MLYTFKHTFGTNNSEMMDQLKTNRLVPVVLNTTPATVCHPELGTDEIGPMGQNLDHFPSIILGTDRPDLPTQEVDSTNTVRGTVREYISNEI